MLAFIYIFILILNAVSILLMYHFLGKELDKKTKWIFIIIGTAIVYMLTSIIYWLGTMNIDLGVDSNLGKNLLVFTFVPVNAIIAMPFLASSFKYFQNGRLQARPFRNRCILVGVILLIILIIEFFYFKDIQTGILSILNANN